MHLRDFGRTALDIRELQQVRAMRAERSRFAVHVASSPLGKMSVTDVQPKDVSAFVRDLQTKRTDDGTKRLSKGTVKNVLQLVRNVFDVAIQEGHRKDNPCATVSAPRENSAQDPWTFLTKEEVAAVECRASTYIGDMVVFALRTGLRQGEQWNLHWDDVDLWSKTIRVRFGSKGHLPKSGKIRTVPMLPCVQTMLSYMQTFRRGRPLVFGTGRGEVLQQGAPPGFEAFLKSCGIARHVRWHDLRHTCATALLQGYWGGPWRLEDVRDFLGHSSVTVTEKYCHSSEGRLAALAKGLL